MTLAIIARLRRWAQSDFLADSEAASDRGGYLSYRAEWHSAAWGAAAGLLFILTGEPFILLGGVGWVFSRAADGSVPGWLPYPKQFAKESLYVAGHAVGMVVLGLAIQHFWL